LSGYGFAEARGFAKGEKPGFAGVNELLEVLGSGNHGFISIQDS